ncbi:MAG: hypothetical protein MUP68_14015, partial [Deltaproteobacteria bacterium]|nr:hypothetical protein [Deltaproteobacteria bacterium]
MRVIVTGGFLRLGGQGASLGIMRRPTFHGLGGKVPPASICGNPANPFLQGFLPADAAPPKAGSAPWP